jgi:hypothetical protein
MKRIKVVSSFRFQVASFVSVEKWPGEEREGGEGFFCLRFLRVLRATIPGLFSAH